MAVNLLPPDARALAKASLLHRSVYLVTTLVLVVYFVIVSAVGGWWLFLSSRQTQLQNQITTLSSQVAQKASQEVLLRQENTRIAQIDEATKKRVDLVSLANQLVPTEPSLFMVGWDFIDSSGKSSLTLTASASGAIEAYSQRLLASFDSISIDALSRTGATWQGNVNVSNTKKP